MSTRNRTIGVIPARYGSTRLPGKVLREIAGKPMLYWVYANALRSPLLDELLIATDSDLVMNACRHLKIPVLLTGDHPTGSDRLYEVMKRTDGDIYVNIQGDEPTVRPEHIEGLLTPLNDCARFAVSTLKVRIDNKAAQDPNVVKVVTGVDGAALYFSRHPIPFDRDGAGANIYFKHIGLYAYRREALQQFFSLNRTPLESAESLEQLRLLENGIQIHVGETPFDTIGVDTEEDLERVISLFQSSVQATVF